MEITVNFYTRVGNYLFGRTYFVDTIDDLLDRIHETIFNNIDAYLYEIYKVNR